MAFTIKTNSGFLLLIDILLVIFPKEIANVDVSDLAVFLLAITRSKQNILFCVNLSKLKGIFYFTVKSKLHIQGDLCWKGLLARYFFNHMATISRYQTRYLKLSLLKLWQV